MPTAYTIPTDEKGNLLVANRVLYDADDDAPTYIGINVRPNAADGDTDWIIRKFTYSGANVTKIVTLKGSWTGRAALAWS